MRKYEKYKGLAYLAILLVVIPYLVWSMALSGTVRMWNSLQETTKRIALLESKTNDMGVELSAGTSQDTVSIFDWQLIEAIHPLTEKYNAKIVKFTPYISENIEVAALYTAELILEGNYAGLVRIIEHIENDITKSRLISVTFKTTRRDRSKPRELTTILILQQIIIEK